MLLFTETTDAGVTTLEDLVTGLEYSYSAANAVEKKTAREQAVEAQQRAIGRIQTWPTFYTLADLVALAAKYRIVS